MNKKYNKYTAILILIYLALTLQNCESNNQNKNAIFRRVKERRAVLPNNILLDTKTVVEFRKNNFVKKNIKKIKKIKILDEWTQFANNLNKKMTENEINIQKIKNTNDVNYKTKRKIKHFEKTNNKLKEKMKKYNLESEEKRKGIMGKMSEDVNDVESGLRNLIKKE